MLNSIVSFTGTQLIQVFGHSTNVFRDGHLIIVKHYNHTLTQVTCIVQGFESHTTGHGTVADDCYNIVVLTFYISGNSHTKSCRNRSTGMTYTKSVVFAFTTFREAGKTTVLTQGVEHIASTGNNLMNVGLVTNVIYNFIFRSGKYLMQSKGKFHHTQVWCQVSTIFCSYLNNQLTDFSCQLHHLLLG